MVNLVKITRIYKKGGNRKDLLKSFNNPSYPVFDVKRKEKKWKTRKKHFKKKCRREK